MQWTGRRMDLFRLVILHGKSEQAFACELGISRTTYRSYVAKEDQPVPPGIVPALDKLAEDHNVDEIRLAMLDGSLGSPQHEVATDNITAFVPKQRGVVLGAPSIQARSAKVGAAKMSDRKPKPITLKELAHRIVANDANAVDAIAFYVWNVRARQILDVLPFARKDATPPVDLSDPDLKDRISRHADEIIDPTSIGRPEIINFKLMTVALLQIDPLPELKKARPGQQRGAVPILAYFNFRGDMMSTLLRNAVYYNIDLSKHYEAEEGHIHDLTQEQIDQRTDDAEGAA